MSWPRVKLGDVATINPRPPRDVDESQQVTFVAMASASEDGYLLASETRILSETRKGFTYFDSNDVLLAKITPCFENGKCLRPGQIPTDIGFGSTEFHVIRPDSEKLDGLYLFYLVWSEQFRFWGEKSMFGAAGQRRVGSDFLKGFEIPLPPLSEQKRIAAILDKADAIRRKRQQAIQLADDFLRAVFLDMFGDPVTNPKGWPTMRVDELCAIVRGSSPRPQGDPRFYGGPVPRLMVADLTRDGKLVTPMIDSLTTEGAQKSRPIEAGTVVMAVSGNVGLTSVLAIDACIHDGFIAFKELDVNKVKPAFLCELMMFLKSTHASRQAGAIFQNLTTSQIKEMEIPIPPSALQDKFLSISRKATELYGEEGFSLFESLSQRAFSGQL
ncbi:restriction endonuclease subunit S [Pseudomonas aeruginosa]|uniref:restriction endonuclease subunit S n=1 Tax=Pseudomonas TaxID=286 RepID=UPI0011B75FCE|nr:restriction endonuclease subunit S [Pseudomonas aeruginosa]MBX6714055.1 restriction endonuclease subunit S [Pseudomonas aeruginosa]MDP5445399.1 restriction endonuclease subunit S [Pseudomonas aeruginosa]MDY1524631.1 restriction endonuclease subunit S [Pseudomonas aeruginosa]MDY1537905.1 restriction endonuclease subunit S [Pseudomonas aeruginosa]TWV95597.1 restriction endonuclease [Pseudomonas aeruginosa]